MPDNWAFAAADDVVKKYLEASEIKGVAQWQTDDGYTFEFHTGHTTGYPIYVRTANSKVDSNLTKFDTNPGVTLKMVNEEVLVTQTGKNPNPITKKQYEALVALVKAEWATFKKIADRYWTNKPVKDPSAPTGYTYTCQSCSTTLSKSFKMTETKGQVKHYCVTCKSKTFFKVVG